MVFQHVRYAGRRRRLSSDIEGAIFHGSGLCPKYARKYHKEPYAKYLACKGIEAISHPVLLWPYDLLFVVNVFQKEIESFQALFNNSLQCVAIPYA